MSPISKNPNNVYTDSNLTLYPGQVVCETLTFNPKAKAPDTKVSLKTCALATGNAQPTPSLPSSPTSDDGTLLKMHVKNNSITGSDYQKKVYAKPGDSLTYCRFGGNSPGYQYGSGAQRGYWYAVLYHFYAACHLCGSYPSDYQ